MSTTYRDDVIAWANEQAEFLRNKQFDLLDVEHLAEEIEDVGKSEQRELESRMAVLLAHLLKWQFQPTHRGSRWQKTIRLQRSMLIRRIEKTPSLKKMLHDDECRFDAWIDGVAQAATETGIDILKFPDQCSWSSEQILDMDFYPD